LADKGRLQGQPGRQGAGLGFWQEKCLNVTLAGRSVKKRKYSILNVYLIRKQDFEVLLSEIELHWRPLGCPPTSYRPRSIH
jgi:hypothetical protein